MKKSQKKQERKINLLKRDNYRCGIHLGGCGKKITLEETTVDHIIPQNILKHDEEHKQRIKFLKKLYKSQTRESLAGGFLNLQPMCPDCNNVKKQGNFPPQNIIKRCSNKCCNFIYIKVKGKWYLIVVFHLLKQDKLWKKDEPVKAKTAYFTFSLVDISITYTDKTNSGEGYILLGKNKTQNLTYEKNKMGGLISKPDMIRNNQRYNKNDILEAIRGFYGEDKNEKDIESSVINSQLHLEESYQNTMKHFNKNIQLNANDSQSYMNRGFVKLNLGDYKQAIEDFSKIIQIKLNSSYLAWAYINRGVCLAHLKKYHEAIEDFNKCIELNPNYSGAYSNRALAKLNLGQVKECLEDCNKAIELNPNDANTYNHQGLAKLNLQHYEEAMEDFTKGIELNPNDINAYNHRGIAKSRMGNHRGAVEDFDKALVLNPNNKAVLHNKESVMSVLTRTHVPFMEI